MGAKKISLMYLNIVFAKTDRDVDFYLADDDEISVVYYPSSPSCCGNESQSTEKVTFKELFFLIEENKNAERLYTNLNSAMDKNVELKNTIKSLENELDTLKSAIDIIKK